VQAQLQMLQFTGTEAYGPLVVTSSFGGSTVIGTVLKDALYTVTVTFVVCLNVPTVLLPES
jgi:hypothetical protein